MDFKVLEGEVKSQMVPSPGRIYLICGAKRSGKDTFAKVLISQTKKEVTTHHLKFAGALKEALKSIFLMTHEQMEDDIKDSVDLRWNMTPRDAMIKMGTDVLQAWMGKTFWCKRLAYEIDEILNKNNNGGGPSTEEPVIIISDLRFHHEIAFMKQKYGSRVTVIRIVKEGQSIPEPTHVSEMEWTSIPVDYSIQSNLK